MAIKLTAKERKELDTMLAVYNSARETLMERCREIAETWQGEYDERSEKWQESDAAEAATDRIDTLNQAADDFENADVEIDLDSLQS